MCNIHYIQTFVPLMIVIYQHVDPGETLKEIHIQ